MLQSRPDAASVLRFCLGADDSGKVAERADGTCTVTIALCRSSYEVTVFEGATFEEALQTFRRGRPLEDIAGSPLTFWSRL